VIEQRRPLREKVAGRLQLVGALPGHPRRALQALAAEVVATLAAWVDGASAYVAGVEDYQLALATYRAACERGPTRRSRCARAGGAGRHERPPGRSREGGR